MGIWVRTGTLSVANGSTAVTGALTGWSSTVRAGDFLFIGSNPAVEVASVTDNTHLTLVQAWPYTTVTNGAYAIAQGISWGDVTTLSVQIANLIGSQVALLSGTGAPSNSLGADGSYYFRSDSPVYYFKAAGAWGAPISLTGAQGPAGGVATTTSATSRTIGTGSMSFVVDAGLSITAGMRLRVANSGSNYMEGTVASYAGTSLTVTMDRFVGSGTFASWTIGPAGDVGSTGPAGASYAGTSTTSLTIGTGSKSLTTQAGLAYVVGSRARVASSASTANWMEGVVTAYSSTSMTVNVDAIGGSGTIAAWNISIAGAQGAQGSQGVQGAAGPSYPATSTTSLTVGTGSKVFTTQAGLAYVVGSRARAADSANPSTNWMDGTVTAYSGTSLTINVDQTAGSGTIASWNISLSGARGADGTNGTNGTNGSNGTSPTYNATSATTLTSATGSKAFTVASGLSFVAGQRVRAASSANLTTNWMSGIVASYASTTLTVTVDLVGSAPASASDWVISITGEKGDQGPAGGFSALSATKGNWALGDGTTWGAFSIGANGSTPIADSAQTYGVSWIAQDAVNAGGYWTSSDVPSAATCDIGAATTPYVRVTGTTTITSFGTGTNKKREVEFTGSLTLTYNGTSLILPGTANILTKAGDKGIFVSDASGNWKCVAWTPIGFLPREKLTAARTYYVRTDGSDSNTGLANTSGGAFLTLQKAWNVVTGTLDQFGFSVTIQVADGTYTAGITSGIAPLGGSILILGNAATPANVIISTTSANCFSFTYKGPASTIRGMTLQTTTSGSGIFAGGNCQIAFDTLVFGACASFHLSANTGGQIINSGSYAISGGAQIHALSQSCGLITIASGATVTITGTPAFSSSFVQAQSCSVITSAGVTWSGSATGVRYSATLNGVIQVFGGGATYFPGGTSGTTATGGQYV